MPFRAVFEGNGVCGLDFDEDGWKSLVERARAAPSMLIMRCCSTQGIPCVSRSGRFFFRHRSKPSNCVSPPESHEHLEMKAAVARAVSEAGWSAEVEAQGPGWEADVLASRGRAKIALEVQLSPQGQAETRRREELYVVAGVMPWWLVNRRNSGDGFGSELKTSLPGKDETKRIAAAAPIAKQVLRQIESQVDIARAVSAALKKRNVEYAVDTIGTIPSAFRFQVDGQEQVIVIGELGRGAVPGHDDIVAGSTPFAWGAAVQFVRRARGQIKGYGARAFFLKGRDIGAEIDANLEALFAGRLIWHPKKAGNRIEAAFVWYDDVCLSCAKPFVRIPFVVQAHRLVHPDFAPKLFPLDRKASHEFGRHVSELQRRLGKPVGELAEANGQSNPAVPMRQSCPSCDATVVDTLVSAEEALGWPASEIDFAIKHEATSVGWIVPTELQERPLPHREAWETSLEKSRAARDAAHQELVEERRRRRADRDANLERSRIAAKEAADARAEEQKREKAEAEKRRQDAKDEAARHRKLERESALEAACQRLLQKALVKWPDPAKAELWMNAFDTKLGGRPRDLCLERYEACLERLKESRFM